MLLVWVGCLSSLRMLEHREFRTSVASTVGYCWFMEIRMHLNVFQCSLCLLCRCIHVVNKKTACKKDILDPSEINLSSPPKSGVFGIQSSFREELKQHLTEHKIDSETFSKQDLADFLLRFCNCVCPFQADWTYPLETPLKGANYLSPCQCKFRRFVCGYWPSWVQ